MRIAIELLGLVPGKIGGMETYARNLVEGLAHANTPHDYTLLVGNEAQGLFPSINGNFKEFVADTAVPSFVRQFRYGQSLFQWAATSRELREWKHDVLHCTICLPRPAWGARNMVITIPDLNFEYLPQLWVRQQAFAMKIFCRIGARLAKKVMTLSHFSKQTIVQRYGVPEERVAVTYMGVDRDLFHPMPDKAILLEIQAQYQLPEKFLFFPANTWLHKNHVGLLKALATLRDEYGLRWVLVLTGAEKHGHQAMVNTMNQLGLDDQVRWLGYVSRQQLAALYQTASVFVFPSLFEGFGVPVIEAMACGCPVVCSRTTSTGEVAGDVAITVDPANPADIAAGIAKMVTDDNLRQEMIEKGFKRAAEFSWERMAQETLRVYEEVGVSHS